MNTPVDGVILPSKRAVIAVNGGAVRVTCSSMSRAQAHTTRNVESFPQLFSGQYFASIIEQVYISEGSEHLRECHAVSHFCKNSSATPDSYCK